MTHPGPYCSACAYSHPEPKATEADQRQKHFIRFSERLSTAGTTLKDDVTQARKRVGKGQYGSGELFSILENVSSIIQTMSGAVLGLDLDGEETSIEVVTKQDLGAGDALVPGTSEWKLYFQGFSQRISEVGDKVHAAVMTVQEETGFENKEIFSILNNAANILHNASSAMEKVIGDLSEEDPKEEETVTGKPSRVEDTPAVSPPTSKTSVKRSADNISNPEEPRAKSVKMDGDGDAASGGGDNNAKTTPAKPATSTTVLFTSRTAMDSSSSEDVAPPEPFMLSQSVCEDGSEPLSGSCMVRGHSIRYTSDRAISLQLIGNRLLIWYQDPPSSTVLDSSPSFQLSINEDNLVATMGRINVRLRPKRGASMSEIIVIVNGEGQLELTLPE